jgi:hypothetical protein
MTTDHNSRGAGALVGAGLHSVSRVCTRSPELYKRTFADLPCDVLAKAKANIYILVPIGIASINDVIISCNVPAATVCDRSRGSLSLRGIAVVSSTSVVAVKCYRSTKFRIVCQAFPNKGSSTALSIEVVVRSICAAVV